MDDFSNDFASLLDVFGKRQGVKLQDLAEKVGVSRNTILNWKAKGRPPTRDDTLKIAKELYLDEGETDRLLASAGYAPKYSPKKIDSKSLPQSELFNVQHMTVEHLEVSYNKTQSRSSARCDFYSHISMPQSYIPRIEVLKGVRDWLLNEHRPVALTSAVQYHKTNALYGMGGIGKSVIARALCDDEQVQARFPDGILWITLGQTPELISKMRDWVNTLGGIISENAPTVDSLKVALAKLLEHRACLLILDDVWHFAHAEIFRVGGSDCRLLITTRDAVIADELRAKIHLVQVMAESEAIALLEEWADGQISKVDHKLKQQIVKRLGYLPLAVKLAGAQLRPENPRENPEEWLKEWLRSFKVHKLKTKRTSSDNVHDSLEWTFNRSLNNLDVNARSLYVALAIFKEDEAILQIGIERLWQGLCGLGSYETTEQLRDLAARALLQIDLSGKVELHDLLREFIGAELKERFVETHQALLKAYRTIWQGTGWHTVENDGYLYDHLAYHLDAADLIEELKGLFANQHWLQKRVPQQDYTYDGYLNDLELTWKYAAIETRQQIETNQEPSAFADCIRYLLIRASINSIAENYVPVLVTRAVEIGLWSQRRALSVASRLPVGTKRAEMYIATLNTTKLSEEEEKNVQRLGLEAALAIEDERRRAYFLGELASHLTGEMLERGLEAALAIEDEDRRTQVLRELAPHLTGEMLERGLEAALAIEDEWRRADVLGELAPYLTGELLKRGLEAALAIEDEWRREYALGKLAPHLRGKLLERGLEAALVIKNEGRRANILGELASHLTGESLKRGLEATLVIKDEWRRAQVLGELASHLKREEQVKALQKRLEAALAIKDEWRRAQVLGELASHLKGEEQVKALQKGLEAALAIVNEGRRAQVLGKLAPHLTAELLERGLEAALAINTSPHRHLSRERLKRGLEAALDIEDEWVRADVLEKLAPHLAAEERVKALQKRLEAALAIEDEWVQADVLGKLVPHLKGEEQVKVLQRGLEATLAIKDERDQARAIGKLAPHLTAELLGRGLEVALDMLEWRRAQVLGALAPHLTGEVLERGLEAALAIKDEWSRAYALGKLAPHLTGELLGWGLEAALAIKDEWIQAYALGKLAPHLTGEEWVKTQRGLMATLLKKDMDDQVVRADILGKLAPHLTGELLKRELEAALAIESKWSRAQVLGKLAPYLKGEVLERVLEAALAIENEWNREYALEELAPYLKGEEQVKSLQRGLEATLVIKDENRRANILKKLAPHLTGALLERGLEAALAMLEWSRAQVLGELVSHLRGEVLERGLEAALLIKDEWSRAQVLGKLAPHLTGKLLERGLEAAVTIKDEQYRAKLLTAFLSSSVDQVQLMESIRMTMLRYSTSIRYRPRQDILRDFFVEEVFAPPVFSQKTIGAITSYVIEICEEWRWL